MVPLTSSSARSGKGGDLKSQGKSSDPFQEEPRSDIFPQRERKTETQEKQCIWNMYIAL